MTIHQIRIAGSDALIDCAADRNILDACIGAGLPMPYNCRSGECGECIATVKAGQVEELPGADPAVFTDLDRAEGRILTCMCFPRSNLEIAVALRDGVAAPKIERVNAAVERIHWHGPDIAEIEVSTPWPLDYRAGQYFDWKIPGIEPDRSFSAANRPGSETIVFHVRIYPGGAASTYVKDRLSSGGVIEIEGPYGHFGLTENDWRPAFLIAGGTGMAPIRALLDDAFARGDSRQLRYFYGARSQSDLYCLEDMAGWASAHGNFSFTPALSDEPERSSWGGARGLITEVLEAEMGDAFGAEAYLCGPPPMIDAAIPILLAAGLDEHDIYYDKFTPARAA